MRVFLAVMGLAAVALLASAAVARAGAVRQLFTYSSFPYTNPCNGELVLASGGADLVTNTVSNAGVEYVGIAGITSLAVVNVSRNTLSGAGLLLQGGGIFTQGEPVTLTRSSITQNIPDQCSRGRHR